MRFRRHDDDLQDTAPEVDPDVIQEVASKWAVTTESIDEAFFNEPITDRMLCAIGEAEFAVVDLTYVQPNVYFEESYAQGLWKTAVHIARPRTEIPFDLKDYPVVLYADMRGLEAALIRSEGDGGREAVRSCHIRIITKPRQFRY